MNNTIHPPCGNFLFLRGCKQVDLWEHTFYLCADITEKSNSTESRVPFQGSQNAKTYLRAKATWVTPTQSCHCSCSFVFRPLPAHSSLFWLTSVPWGMVNSRGAALSEANQRSFTHSCSFKACCRSCRVAGKAFHQNSLSLSKLFYSLWITQIGGFGK